MLRGALDPNIVYVIPNAVVASQFRPSEPIRPTPKIRETAFDAVFLPVSRTDREDRFRRA